MMADPRKACANNRESLGWALLHDAVAHPLMALTLYSHWALRFHDYTSTHAWPRATPETSAGTGAVIITSNGFGEITMTELSTGIYSVQHPRVAHTFVTNAEDFVEAANKAIPWFRLLAVEFGGEFLQGK